MDLPFKQYYALQESVEVDLSDEEKKFLRYLVNIITGQAQLERPRSNVISSNFQRIFKFDPYRVGRKFYHNFDYELTKPRESYFKNPKEIIEKISKISGIKDIHFYMSIDGYIHIEKILNYLKKYYKEDPDTFYKKSIKILGVIFNGLAERYIDAGHEGWIKYYRGNADFRGLLNAI